MFAKVVRLTMNPIKILTLGKMILWSLIGFVFLLIGLTSSDDKSFIGIVLFPVFLSLFLISLKAHKMKDSKPNRSLLLLFIPSIVMFGIGIYLLKLIIFQTSEIYINGVVFCFVFLSLSFLYVKLAIENREKIIKEFINPERNRE